MNKKAAGVKVLALTYLYSMGLDRRNATLRGDDKKIRALNANAALLIVISVALLFATCLASDLLNSL